MWLLVGQGFSKIRRPSLAFVPRSGREKNEEKMGASEASEYKEKDKKGEAKREKEREGGRRWRGRANGEKEEKE